MQKTVIVVPCYNEAGRLPSDRFSGFLSVCNWAEIIFVDDGSRDATYEAIEKLRAQFSNRISIFRLARNRGKAEAVRQGMIRALSVPNVKYAGYLDADLATSLETLEDFVKILENNSAVQMTTGSRIRRLGAHIDRTLFRHFTGRIFATIVSFLLKLPVYDTQCGAKLFRTEFARDIFEKPFLSRWLFDVEIFFRIIRRYGVEKTLGMVYEVSLKEWRGIGASKLSIMSMLRTPMNLIRISRAYRLK
jgi:glycosyltransferase involved in cell wall biosynthesis